MTSVCLLIVLLFSEQGETMQCAVWKDEHPSETENRSFGFPFLPKKIYIFRKDEHPSETAVSVSPTKPKNIYIFF